MSELLMCKKGTSVGVVVGDEQATESVKDEEIKKRSMLETKVERRGKGRASICTDVGTPFEVTVVHGDW